jgi:hypothetical protein
MQAIIFDQMIIAPKLRSTSRITHLAISISAVVTALPAAVMLRNHSITVSCVEEGKILWLR